MNQSQLQMLAGTYNDTQRIPDEIIEHYIEFKAPRVELDETSSILKITHTEEVIPYLNELFVLIDSNIPSTDPLTMADLLGKIVHSKSGRSFDIATQWDGTSFLMLDKGKVVGACLGHKEVEVLEDGTRLFTGNGFMPTFVADQSIRSTYKPILTGLACCISLWNEGCDIVKCSTHSTNIQARRLYESVATSWYEDGEFFKYIFDREKVKNVYQLILRRARLSTEKLNLLNNLIYGHTTNES